MDIGQSDMSEFAAWDDVTPLPTVAVRFARVPCLACTRGRFLLVVSSARECAQFCPFCRGTGMARRSRPMRVVPGGPVLPSGRPAKSALAAPGVAMRRSSRE
jgi:hypothetical protein